MKRRNFLVASASAAFLTACGDVKNSSPIPEKAAPKVVVPWNNALLEAIRVVKPGPPMLARALAILHTAMYDAWAAYDDLALATTTGASLRRPAAERTAMNKAKAISYAAFQVLVDQYPTERARFEALMSKLEFPLSNSSDTTTAEGIGNATAKIILAARHADGSNQLGNLTASGVAFADYTDYKPSNLATVFTGETPASAIAAPDHWQPLTFTDAAGVVKTPSFIAPHWRNVTPFALATAFQFRPSAPAAFGSSEFVAQAEEIIRITANLTDKQKVIAEYWADGPSSELPPGHFCLFAQFVSARDKNDDDKDVKLFFAMGNAMLDASIATWESKRFYDYVRPVTAIRYLNTGKTIKGYGAGGVSAGIVDIKGEAWRPYQPTTFPTPPFSEHTSGHSAFSAAGAEVLKQFTGSDAFGGSYTQAKASLKVEPSAPTAEVKLEWATFSAAADEAGMSRLYGGIHFTNGDQAGRTLGRKVGAQVFAKAQALWSGKA